MAATRRLTVSAGAGLIAILMIVRIFSDPLNQVCAAEITPTQNRPKKIFAHYMGCYPINSLTYLHSKESLLKPDGPAYLDRIGGRWRDFPLMPADYKPTLEEAVDLEMRWAMRMGLDGFAVDVLAGQQMALDTLDALFKVAEQKKYPFEITICLDNPELNLRAVRNLAQKHASSPNLARRDGKVLMLGYRSHRWGQRLRPDISPADWAKLDSIKEYGKAVDELEGILGQPIAAQFCLNGFVPNQQDNDASGYALTPDFWNAAIGELGKKYGGVSAFFWGGEQYDLAAKAAHRAGIDWGEPMWVQYQSLAWNTFRVKDGTDLMRERWDKAIANDASLIQIATWNDYTETTHVAPAFQTGYAVNELMRIMIKRWKDGHMPTPSHDQVFLFYPAYPHGSKVFPFADCAPELTSELEVVTFLPAPARINMPGRHISWDAPAGLYVKKLPPAAGPVIAEVIRAGQTSVKLQGREPITDRPFRPQHSLVAYSTEDERNWQQDFPGAKPAPSYYGDDDGDGLPNWFEMYYYGKLGDFTTATAAEPNQVAACGKTNLQAYLEQIDPRTTYTTPAIGTVWTPLKNPLSNSTNPEIEPGGPSIWRYVGAKTGSWSILSDAQLVPNTRQIVTVAYSRATRNALARSDEKIFADVTYRWRQSEEKGQQPAHSLALRPTSAEPVAIEWTSPIDGTYRVDVQLTLSNSQSRTVYDVRLAGPDPVALWNTQFSGGKLQDHTSTELALKRGDVLRLEARTPQNVSTGVLEVTQLNITRIK